MRDLMSLETTEQIRALAHPVRQRILRLLTTEPMTNQQLAQALDESPARLHFHVRGLHQAGLIELVAERPKGGVLEKYYSATARNFRLHTSFSAPDLGEGLLSDATLDAARHEFVRAVGHYGDPVPNVLMAHQGARLSEERLARVREHLAALDEEFHAAAEADEEIEGRLPVALTYLLHPLPPDTSA